MADQKQFRRGTTAYHASFTGAAGEITVDTDKNVPVVHDGSTPGGYPGAQLSGANTWSAKQTFSSADISSITNDNIPYISASGFADSPISTDGSNVAIGATLLGWSTANDVMQIGGGTSILNGGGAYFSKNVYFDGSSWKRIATGYASQIVMNYSASGGIDLYVAGSATADTAVTWTTAMSADSSGSIGMGGGGTIDASNTLSVDNTEASGIGNIYSLRSGGSTSRTHITFANSNGNVGSITTSGTATAYNTSSDYRLKENPVWIVDGIARVKQLRPIRFNFIGETKTIDGFMAHEAQAVVPEAVTGDKDALDADGEPIYQGIDQSKIVPLLTAALQEEIAKREALAALLVEKGVITQGEADAL